MIRSCLLSTTTFCTFALPALSETIVVTASDDRGEGSLRVAFAAAAAATDPTHIVVTAENPIQISETLVYMGRAPLSIFGSGQTISADKNFTLLVVSEGADLSVSNLSFEGPGGFDINARADGQPGKGIFLDVRDDQTGAVNLDLKSVKVTGVAGHGVHISDCDLADDCGAGGGGAGGGSDASIIVRMSNVTIEDVGNGSFDADGLRVDERGAGDIVAHISNSLFTAVGADGVELDEGQDGNVVAQVVGTRFEANGIYCDPAILEAFLPDPDEQEFDQGARAEADIPGPVTGSPDDGCIEREVDLYDDGSVEVYEFGIDVDDGFDIDEAGPGNIEAVLVDTAIAKNLDEGADFDEEDAGSIDITVVGGSYGENADDGIKLSEEGAGDVVADLLRTSALSNGGKGLVFEEEDEGNVVVSALSVTTGNNDDSDDTGIEAVQEDEGSGNLRLSHSDIADGIDAEGVDLN